MSTSKSYLPATEFAAATLGAQIVAARRQLGWTQDELAGRLGVTRHLVARIEAGSLSATLGVAFEAAVTCGVQLFGVDATELSRVADRERDRVALLPARVRMRVPVIPNDF